jgi:hypothetical protein
VVEVSALYSLGPNLQPITNLADTDIMVGFNGHEFIFDGWHSAKVVWCYNNKL